MSNFIFEDINSENTVKFGDYWYTPAKLKNYWYYVRDSNAEVLYKVKDNIYEEYLKQYSEIPNSNKKIHEFEWNNVKYYLIYKGDKHELIDEFDNVVIASDYQPLLIWRIKEKPHFIVIESKTGLYSVIDIEKNIKIPFGKYKYLSSFTFDEKVYFCACSAETNLCGIIDINENIVIPFIYDEIHDWNIDMWQHKTIQVVYKGKCGIIDINNNIVLPFKYKYIYGFYSWDEYSF
ncbi:WG repeat-containing protein, partial [bacterium]|nr:WG repeat-containing protein [bacterium]